MVVPVNISDHKEQKHLAIEMRVKDKTHPGNGSGISTSLSSPKKQILGQVSVINVESNAEVLDLSKPGADKLKNGNVGTTETDAIHRRLCNTDSEVGNLAHSILESIELTSPGRKRKNSSPKKETPCKKPNNLDVSIPPVLDHTLSEKGHSDLNEKSLVKIEADDPQQSTDRTVINSCSENNQVVQEKQLLNTEKVKANGSLNQSSSEHNPASASKAKKKVGAVRKPNKKKNAKKKKTAYQKDEGDFEIDPRLGGSKIKDAMNKKGKDKKVKLDSTDSKKIRVCEQRFPYIHIEGSWNSPQVVKIVNGHLKEDDSEGKVVAKLTRAAQYVDEEHRNRAAKVGFTSTLSDRYDSHNRDVTWICVFCQQYTHMQCLGDLYGPYFVNQVSAEPIWFSRKNPDSVEISAGSATTGVTPLSSASKKGKKSPKKKATVKSELSSVSTTPIPPVPTPTSGETSSGVVALNPRKTDGVDLPSEERREVWFHESCVIWAPGVYLVPPRLLGLDEAIADSQQANCDHCKKTGAHIFCRARGCGLRSHFPCAVSNSWLLNEESFLALCPAHNNQQQPATC